MGGHPYSWNPCNPCNPCKPCNPCPPPHPPNPCKPCDPCGPSKGDEHDPCSSKGYYCHPQQYKPIPSADVAVSQQLKSEASTLAQLSQANSPSSGVKAGNIAYREARGCISEEQYLAEQSQAFEYFVDRFGLPSDYRLEPIGSIAGLTGIDLATAERLGLPLWRVQSAGTGPDLQTIGYYRPAVYCQKVNVTCFRQRGACTDFDRAVFAEHQLYLITPASMTGSVSGAMLSAPGGPQCNVCPCIDVTLPEKISPQYVQQNPVPLAVSIYGYLTLLKRCQGTYKVAEIMYRSLYQTSHTFSLNLSAPDAPPEGDTEGNVYFGHTCEAASIDLSNGEWNGLMTLFRSYEFRAVIAPPPSEPVSTLPSIIGNAYANIVNDANVHFPRTCDRCTIPKLGEDKYAYPV